MTSQPSSTRDQMLYIYIFNGDNKIESSSVHDDNHEDNIQQADCCIFLLHRVTTVLVIPCRRAIF